MNWYISVLKNYVTFNGRARRTEYWMFTLFNIIFSIVAGVLDAVLGLGFINLIYTLAVLLPAIAVGVRRLHDTDRSGWWMLIGLIPLIGAIVLLVFFCLEGEKQENRFGADPKAA
ncbi:DUF805 domain-containing protein [Pseudaeromonas paramecii]|uniref:DUF805 domain-containing protein n=1 Tax=Pseudaeromonas paramecii TaxID=2138166 RepID=A0ABP8Q3T5_9GAMM